MPEYTDGNVTYDLTLPVVDQTGRSYEFEPAADGSTLPRLSEADVAVPHYGIALNDLADTCGPLTQNAA